jgi:hypothetical protein
VYAEVETTLYADATGATLIAPLPGLALGPARVELGSGLALVAGDAFDAPGEAVWPPAPRRGRVAEPNALCVLEYPDADDLPLEDGRDELYLLLRRLRLYKEGAIGVGALGWVRSGGGVWQPFELEPSPPGHGADWTLAEDELERALELEQLAISGRAFPPYLAEIGAEQPGRLTAEVEGYLRALLRDTYCGYLDQDLRRVADDLLVESGEPLEIKAADLRQREEPGTEELAAVGAEDSGTFETGELGELEPRAVDESQDLSTLDEPEPEPVPEPAPSEPEPEASETRWAPPEPDPYVPEPEDGVTDSVDWGFDDDTGTYSAPV